MNFFYFIPIVILLTMLQIFFIFLYNKIAINFNFVDIPSERKLHKGKIPMTGGAVIFTMILFYYFIFPTDNNLKIIFIVSSFIFIIGLIDDKMNLPFAYRFVLQFLASITIIGFGIRIYDLGEIYNISINLGGFGIILSALSIVGFTNSINFSDGLDGLASGYIINGLISLLIFSIFFGNYNNLEIIIFLTLFLIIFLFSNFKIYLPKTFLGDSGSTFLGFFISCLILYYTLPENRYFHPVLALWVCPMPIYDFITIFFRRIINNKSPFLPDMNHLHHQLLKLYKNQNFVSLLLISCSFLLSIFGILSFIILGAASCFLLFFIFLFFYIVLNLSLSKTIN